MIIHACVILFYFLAVSKYSHFRFCSQVFPLCLINHGPLSYTNFSTLNSISDAPSLRLQTPCSPVSHKPEALVCLTQETVIKSG